MKRRNGINLTSYSSGAEFSTRLVGCTTNMIKSLPWNQDILTRFWTKVDKNGPTLQVDLGPCWVWTASRRRKRKDAKAYGGTKTPVSLCRYKRGIDHPNSKLTPILVKRLRDDRIRGMSYSKLANKYGVAVGYCFQSGQQKGLGSCYLKEVLGRVLHLKRPSRNVVWWEIFGSADGLGKVR